jgi:HSP20 family molecular chaperone IbpA
VTPGLRKDELRVEMVDTSGQTFLEVSAQTADTSEASSPAAKAGSEDLSIKDLEQDCGAKLVELRGGSYGAFKELVLLPKDVDREAMWARYEDGLLVVSIPRAKSEDVKPRVTGCRDQLRRALCFFYSLE